MKTYWTYVKAMGTWLTLASLMVMVRCPSLQPKP